MEGITIINRSTILVVDDNPDLTEIYADWLRDEYTVRTAYNGDQALKSLDDEVDVVLIDRKMPQKSGDSVVAQIEKSDVDCRIAMITAVDPDFDIIEMEIDEYLIKPLLKSELKKTAENLIIRSKYDKRLQEYYKLASKVSVLETEKTQEELENNEDFTAMLNELKRIRRELNDVLAEVAEKKSFEKAFVDMCSGTDIDKKVR